MGALVAVTAGTGRPGGGLLKGLRSPPSPTRPAFRQVRAHGKQVKSRTLDLPSAVWT